MSYDEEYQEEYEVIEEEVLAGELTANQDEVLTMDRKVIAQLGGTLQRRNVRLRFLASCGHLIHSLDELGGKCQHKNCEALVCEKCLKACERCGKLLCPKHQKLHNGSVLCPTCKLIAMFFGFSPRNQEQVSRRQRNIAGSIFYNLFQRPVWKAPPLYDLPYPVQNERINKRRRSHG